MGQITINTPQGPALVDIAGDTITQEELARLRELAPPAEGETLDYTVVRRLLKKRLKLTPGPNLNRLTERLKTYLSDIKSLGWITTKKNESS